MCVAGEGSEAGDAGGVDSVASKSWCKHVRRALAGEGRGAGDAGGVGPQ